MLGAAIATLSLAMLASLLVFGSETVVSYFTHNIASKLPDYAYTETINQSLLATILRMSGNFASASPVREPVYLALAALLLLITGLLISQLDFENSEIALGLTLLLGLLLYPVTLSHYCVVLSLVILICWRYRNTLVAGPWLTAGLISGIYLLTSYRHGIFSFYAIALLWIIFAAAALWQVAVQRRWLNSTSPIHVQEKQIDSKVTV
jgi:hypothetical protein